MHNHGFDIESKDLVTKTMVLISETRVLVQNLGFNGKILQTNRQRIKTIVLISKLCFVCNFIKTMVLMHNQLKTRVLMHN